MGYHFLYYCVNTYIYGDLPALIDTFTMVCYVFYAATECTYGWHRELRPRLASARISDVEVLLSSIDHSIHCLSSTE